MARAKKVGMIRKSEKEEKRSWRLSNVSLLLPQKTATFRPFRPIHAFLIRPQTIVGLRNVIKDTDGG